MGVQGTAAALDPVGDEGLPALFRRNPYALTALFLAPRLEPATTAALRSAIRGGSIEWGGILTVANLHFTTPLLYVRLRQHGLLPDLPPELRDFLHCLYEGNCERNDAFRTALGDLLQIAAEINVSCLLLKGAAALVDDLYGDPGARMLGDLDVLVEPPGAERLWRELLRRGGYMVAEKDFPDYSRLSPTFQTHHLPRLVMPGTPAVVEIHSRPARGQAGRGLPAARFWAGGIPVEIAGNRAFIPDPATRLLHLTLHALIPSCEFIMSRIPLGALAEFSALRQRFGASVQEKEWLAAGGAVGLGHEFLVFHRVAERLMAPGDGRGRGWRTQSAQWRILEAGRLAADGGASGDRPEWRKTAITLAIRVYYLSHLFGWIWRNPCHADGLKMLPQRLLYLRNWMAFRRERRGH